MRAVFLDIETTGLDPLRHSAIDVAFKIVDLTADETLAAYQSLVRWPRKNWDEADPISLQVNGYQWEEILQGKEPKKIQEEIISLLQEHRIIRKQAVFICQNPAFDRSFFTQIVPVYTQERFEWPYHWLDLASMYWAKCMHTLCGPGAHAPVTMNLSKDCIAEAFGIPKEATPHKAINGVDHLITCYRAVMQLAQ